MKHARSSFPPLSILLWFIGCLGCRKCVFPSPVHVDLLSAIWRSVDIPLLSNSDVPPHRASGPFLLPTAAANSPSRTCVLGCFASVIMARLVSFFLFFSFLKLCIWRQNHTELHILYFVCWQWLCPCACVSCRWYFPRAPCYAGQLLYPSSFDSSAATPWGGWCVCVCGGSHTKPSRRGCACVARAWVNLCDSHDYYTVWALTRTRTQTT